MRPPVNAALTVAVLLIAAAIAWAQADVRPDDPLGMSIRLPRVQIMHSETADLAGASMYLQQADPWLGYELGWYMFARQWSTKEGLFTRPTGHSLTAAASSCALCHNLPSHAAGYGGNLAESGGNGRKARHLFGIGLEESLAIQIRQQLLAEFDTNHNGFLDYPSETRGKRAIIEAVPGVKVDFGALDDLDGDGQPDLNDIILPLFVDAQGRVASPVGKRPARLGDSGVAGYDIAVAFLASSASDHQVPSIRSFAVGVVNTIFAMPIVDASISPTDKAAGQHYWASVSNAGAPQMRFPLRPVTDTCQYVSSGDLDVLEWFLLNHPAPAESRQTAETRRGKTLLHNFGCTSCHVQEWRIQPHDEATGVPGDRRFFNLAVHYDPASGGLKGAVQDLTKTVAGPNGLELRVPKRDGFLVRDIYTDQIGRAHV